MHNDILIYAPAHRGGLAEYTFHQVRALHQLGGNVLCLASRGFLAGRPCPFRIERRLWPAPAAGGLVFMRRFGHGVSLLANEFRLAWWVLRRRPGIVLLDSYVEYLSPLWIWPHILLARILGVRYVANLHDPVRSYQVGPKWWHRMSVRLAFLPLDSVLIHGELPDLARVPAAVRVYQVPHGAFDIRPSSKPAGRIRAELGASPQHRVFLAFGYVRDGKNLDLAIEAVAEVPEAFLVIAGSVASTNDRPFSFYRNLAVNLGVADRVTLREGFVPEEDLADFFAVSDFILLTYSSAFHSQSGVLNLAAHVHRPVLASSAPSPLLAAVSRFSIGVTVTPDSARAIADGMRQLIHSPPNPRWEDYDKHASWEANARQVLELLPAFQASTGQARK